MHTKTLWILNFMNNFLSLVSFYGREMFKASKKIFFLIKLWNFSNFFTNLRLKLLKISSNSIFCLRKKFYFTIFRVCVNSGENSTACWTRTCQPHSRAISHTLQWRSKLFGVEDALRWTLHAHSCNTGSVGWCAFTEQKAAPFVVGAVARSSSGSGPIWHLSAS